MTEIILDSVVSVKPKAEIVSVSLKPSACKHPGSPTLCLSLVSKETKLRAVVCFLSQSPFRMNQSIVYFL